MRTLLTGCIVAAFSVTAAIAAPQQPAGNKLVSSDSADGGAEVTGQKAQPTTDKKICRLLPSSYSRMTERVCLTKEDWAKVEKEAE